jgi:hypothetical protein
MSWVKQASKRKRLTKAVGVPALSVAGLSLSLVGSASASAVATADGPESLNTTPDQRFILSEEEIADVSLATFHLFDKESGIAGFTQIARGCGCGGCGGRGCGGGGCRGCGGGGGCRGGFGGCGCRGCGCAGCGGGGGCGIGFGCGVGVGFGWGGWGGCGYGGCCISWGGCRLC